MLQPSSQRHSFLVLSINRSPFWKDQEKYNHVLQIRIRLTRYFQAGHKLYHWFHNHRDKKSQQELSLSRRDAIIKPSMLIFQIVWSRYQAEISPVLVTPLLDN